MRITPLDIKNHPFPRRVSGYDREEVDTFLRMVAEDYEGVVAECSDLRSRIKQLEQRVQELTANERLLQDTLTSAQELAEDLKATAGEHVAAYKLPKAFVFVDEILRSPSGKADYRWARATAEERLGASS